MPSLENYYSNYYEKSIVEDSSTEFYRIVKLIKDEIKKMIEKSNQKNQLEDEEIADLMKIGNELTIDQLKFMIEKSIDENDEKSKEKFVFYAVDYATEKLNGNNQEKINETFESLIEDFLEDVFKKISKGLDEISDNIIIRINTKVPEIEKQIKKFYDFLCKVRDIQEKLQNLSLKKKLDTESRLPEPPKPCLHFTNHGNSLRLPDYSGLRSFDDCSAQKLLPSATNKKADVKKNNANVLYQNGRVKSNLH